MPFSLKLYQLYPHLTAAFLQVTLSVVTVGPPEAVATWLAMVLNGWDLMGFYGGLMWFNGI